MRLVDTNVLLYAVDETAPHHSAARGWLERALSETETVGFAWNALLGFIRLATNARVFTSPLSVGEAHLAALAIEHGAQVCSTDRDVARFAGVELIDPLLR